jgi:hypothetical protein
MSVNTTQAAGIENFFCQAMMALCGWIFWTSSSAIRCFSSATVISDSFFIGPSRGNTWLGSTVMTLWSNFAIG